MDEQEAAQILDIPYTQISDELMLRDKTQQHRDVEAWQQHLREIEEQVDRAQLYMFFRLIMPVSGPWGRRRNVMKLAFNAHLKGTILTQQQIAAILNVTAPTISKDVDALERLMQKSDKIYQSLWKALPDTSRSLLVRAILKQETLKDIMTGLAFRNIRSELGEIKRAFKRILDEADF